MAEDRFWHGAKKCPVKFATIPKANRVVGQPCPWCGSTIGAYIGSTPVEATSTSSTADQLANLQQLYEDGLITDDEYAERRKSLLDDAVTGTTPAPPAPRKTPAAAPVLAADVEETKKRKKRNNILAAADRPIWRRRPVAIIVVTLVLIVVATVFTNSRTDGGGGSGSSGGGLTAEERATVSRIESLTNCGELQSEFDIADANSGEAGTDRFTRSILYMETADDRMRALGCYD